LRRGRKIRDFPPQLRDMAAESGSFTVKTRRSGHILAGSGVKMRKTAPTFSAQGVGGCPRPGSKADALRDSCRVCGNLHDDLYTKPHPPQLRLIVIDEVPRIKRRNVPDTGLDHATDGFNG
jgi:hypothetical protein